MTQEELASLENTFVPDENDPFANTASVTIETKKEEVTMEKVMTCPICLDPTTECDCAGDCQHGQHEKCINCCCPECGNPYENCKCKKIKDQFDPTTEELLEQVSQKLEKIEKNYGKLLDAYRKIQSENQTLKAEMYKLKTNKTYPAKPISPIPPATQRIREAAASTVKVDITAEAMKTLPLLEGADKPNDMGTCPTHGTVRSNKWRKCSKCGADAAKQAWADNYRR